MNRTKALGMGSYLGLQNALALALAGCMPWTNGACEAPVICSNARSGMWVRGRCQDPEVVAWEGALLPPVAAAAAARRWLRRGLKLARVGASMDLRHAIAEIERCQRQDIHSPSLKRSQGRSRKKTIITAAFTSKLWRIC